MVAYIMKLYLQLKRIVTFNNFIVEDSEGHGLGFGEEGGMYL